MTEGVMIADILIWAIVAALDYFYAFHLWVYRKYKWCAVWVAAGLYHTYRILSQYGI